MDYTDLVILMTASKQCPLLSLESSVCRLKNLCGAFLSGWLLPDC
ncbi:hypothetical protein STRDD11_01291 [Streptococcus sp. DD11]|nr:hypothetical protein STRDD11_01291 [Streptococcus sp. DD11]